MIMIMIMIMIMMMMMILTCPPGGIVSSSSALE